MAPRREILDSEDDGSDFGDVPLFGGEEEMPCHDTVAAHESDQTIINASRSAGTDSTDPSFFQRIYDQQQAAADAHDAIPDTAPADADASAWTEVSSAPPPGQKPHAKDFSSLTSITDPIPASRKSKKTREVAQTEIIGLTDLTTPRNEAASGTSDIWDVPASTKSQRSTKTYGKRKLGQLSLEQEVPADTMPDTQDPYAFPASSPPARKTGVVTARQEEEQARKPLQFRAATARFQPSDAGTSPSRGTTAQFRQADAEQPEEDRELWTWCNRL
jgi:hypothetical protein